MIYLILIPMLLIAVYSGYQNKINFKKMGLWYFLFIFLICIITNILALKNLLFHAEFVPGNLKDGFYGFMGGASFGAIMLNLMLAAFLFGLLINIARNENISIKKNESNDINRAPWVFPEWFNRISHAISGCIVGSAFGIAWLSFKNHKPIEAYGDLTIGSIIGAAGIYTIAAVFALIQKMKK